ncbi:myelin-associated glycoprotein-like isoform X3 [Phyllobates terribilis]|uniref:myelin-associated glycoprotein-like isoform X3 n=1 Tax=Phyllobates terribilis TaxID=111132 RepID=UPI003CCAE02B
MVMQELGPSRRSLCLVCLHSACQRSALKICHGPETCFIHRLHTESYKYSDPKRPSEIITGIWYSYIDEESNKNTQFINSRTPVIHTSFIGDLGSGNCSIKIHKVQHENSKIYRFRVEMENFLYSYYPSVLLNISDNPPHPILIFPNQTIPEATDVTLKCSTVYTCPSDPPDLVWSSLEGEVNVMCSYEGAGVWKVESKQVINMSRKHDGMSISCHANYSSGTKSQVMRGNLSIIYKPEILQKSHCKKDLSTIICECAAVANPSANITWNHTEINVTQTSGFSINSSSNGSNTMSRLEGTMMPSGDLWCTASNIQGSVTHILPIYEKPQILQESQCNKTLGAIDCECVVIANPPAIISWNSSDGTITEVSRVSINSSSHGSKMVSRLEGAVIPPGGLHCTAINTEGSVSQKLPIYVDWTMPILIGGGILVFLVLCVTAAVCAMTKCRKNNISKPNSYVMEDRTYNSDISTKERKKRHHSSRDDEDRNTCAIYGNSGNIYMNSISQNHEEEVYVNAEEEKGKKENKTEDIYINCLSY